MARRSKSNYAHLIADRLDANLTDLSISGATLSTMLSDQQNSFPPQISQLPEDADVVFVLGGGNDIGYVGGIFTDVIQSFVVGRMLLNTVGFVRGNADLFPGSDMDEQELADKYGALLDAIHTKAPKAKVIVVEYLTLFGDDATPALVGLPEDRIRHHRDVAAKLQRGTAKTVDARKSWCDRVPVHELSQQHGIGSKEPWVVGYGWDVLWRKDGSFFHPNAAGMKAVAEMMQDRIGTIQSSESKN